MRVLETRVRLRTGGSVEFALLIEEFELVITDAEPIPVVNVLALDPLALELDAVRRAHVDNEVLSVRELDQSVLSGYVWILDR